MIDGIEYNPDREAPLSDISPEVLAWLRPQKTTPTTCTTPNLAANGDLPEILNRIDPNCGYEPWRGTIWSVLASYGPDGEVIGTLRRWSKRSWKYDDSSSTVLYPVFSRKSLVRLG